MTTYVGLVNDAVIGYYSQAASQVEHADTPERLRKGLARHPVPIMLLVRLAVHKDRQGKGIGRAILRDAVLRTLQAADVACIRALAVHAKDDKARQNYEQFDLTPSPADPLRLLVLLKDLRKKAGTYSGTRVDLSRNHSTQVGEPARISIRHSDSGSAAGLEADHNAAKTRIFLRPEALAFPMPQR